MSRVLPSLALAMAATSAATGVAAQSAGSAQCPCVSVAQRSTVYPGWSDALYVNADGSTKVEL